MSLNEEFAEELVDALTKIMKDLKGKMDPNVLEAFIGGNTQASSELNVGIDFTLLQRQAMVFLEEYETPFLHRFVAELKGNIFNAISQGIEQGLDMNQISRNLGRLVDESKSNLLRIARTETIRASNEGALMRYFSLGVEWKKFIPAPTACPDCLTIYPRIVPIDEPFSSGHMSPPIHPYCRCAVGAITRRGIHAILNGKIYNCSINLNGELLYV